MKFNVSLGAQNLPSAMRQCGYAPDGRDAKTGELRFWRSLGGRRYPRFHLYAAAKDDTAVCNLHLDQKQPSYQGTSRPAKPGEARPKYLAAAHSGEYESQLVEQEMRRILDSV